MIIFIKIEGAKDLKGLVRRINKEQDLSRKIFHILEYLNYPGEGDVQTIDATLELKK